MYINDCRHTFVELAQTVLPMRMAQLERAIEFPWFASDFSQVGQGPAAVAAKLGRTSDFSGCYVLMDGEHPIYVGISRNVLTRLRQHMLGTTHFTATLAYAMAQRQQPTVGKRSVVMNIVEFRKVFDERQKYLRGLSVATVEIQNPLELYLFEAYAAMSLKTMDWNTFRTH